MRLTLKSITKKKAAAIGLAFGVAAGAGGIAAAYFTSTGTGTGSAQTGTASTWTVKTGTAAGGPLTPGGPAETVTYTVKNTSTGSQDLTSVQISVANASGSPWTNGSCNATDFSIDTATAGTVATDTSLAGNFASGQTKQGTITIKLVTNNQNQDTCENVAVPLYLHAS